MRTISLVKRLKWNFSGNMNPHALIIGDVDNDNENEFVIGNLNGDLAIFKGKCTDGFPSYVCRGLGTITCIAIGDVRNHGKNSVVVINAEGHAHIFDLPPKFKDQQQPISVDDYLRGGRRSSDTASIQAFRRMMSGAASTPPPINGQQQGAKIHDLGKPNLTLKVPVNVNKILIADIDHDDLNELILARTDRILHAFQLVPSDTSDHLYKGIQTPSLSPSASTINFNTQSSKKQDSATTKLLDKNMWVFDGQITSLCTTSHPDLPNEPLLLVAQPGNTFTIIDQDGKRFNRDFTPQQSTTTTTFSSKSTLSPPSSSLNANGVETEDITHIKSLLDTSPETCIEIFQDESTLTTAANFKRSNHVVKNWPIILDTGNDDQVGAVATEIVTGKRPGDTTHEVGMLSMDGKFSIYDLRTRTISQRDLFVTHKLFSLATLDMSSSVAVGTSSSSKQHVPRTPSTTTSNLRYTATREGSRTSSKLNVTATDNKNSSHGDEEDSSSSDDSLGDEQDDSDYESVPWSEEGETEDQPMCDLFVACAWNGVTYLIDWSKKSDNDIKYQLIKFAFEGRVCAFTAGLYAVENQINVPCLFYVDFEDQIYVYYDVRISPGPVTGFIDMIDDDVEEALDRIMGIESSMVPTKKKQQQDAIDLGDGWQGIADDDEEEEEEDLVAQQQEDPLNLADFIHECLYGFEDMKDRMENEVLMFEQNRLSSRLPPGGDTRRLSDLNINPPALDNDVTSDAASLNIRDQEEDNDLEMATAGLYSIHSNISEESSESYDQHIASWIEGSLIGSYSKEVEQQQHQQQEEQEEQEEEQEDNDQDEDDSSDIS